VTVVNPELSARLGVGAGLQVLLTTALDALTEALAGTVGGPCGRAVIAPGSVVPADGCCAEEADEMSGQAHVRLSRLFPSRVFPQPDAAYSRAPSLLAAEVELGVYRCVAGMDDAGYPPTPEEVTADAVRALDDLAAMRRTALETFGRTPVVVGASSPVGPNGYCAGATMLFTVSFNPDCAPGLTVVVGG
jgi:hypothetical protein